MTAKKRRIERRKEIIYHAASLVLTSDPSMTVEQIMEELLELFDESDVNEARTVCLALNSVFAPLLSTGEVES